MYNWDFLPVLSESGLLLAGFRNTLILTATALTGGLLVGLFLLERDVLGAELLLLRL